MRLSGTRTGDLLDAVAARCERLVNAAVRDTQERASQRRLIGLSLVAPFMLAAPVAILFAPVLGTGMTLAAVGAIFGVSFVSAFTVAVTGRASIVQAFLLLYGAGVLTAIVAASGGAGAPAAALLAALVFEAWWVRRTKSAVLTGVGAMFAALLAQGALHIPVGWDGASAANWLMPLAYLALVAPRLAAWLEEGGRDRNSDETPLEQMIEAVILKMDLSGEITDASQQARRILCLAPELLLSGGLFDRIHVADRVGYLCALSDLKESDGYRRVDIRAKVPDEAGRMATDYRAFTLEMMRPTAHDSFITVLMRKAGDHAADGANGLAAEAVEKIELANSRKLAAVSHELRTPLNSIIGFSDMLLHEMAGNLADPRQKEYIGLVRESGCHLLSVVNSILDVSKLEAGAYAANSEPFRFSEAVEMCKSMLAQQALDKELELKNDVSTEIGEVYADKRVVKQILINLVSNAVKFTPKGGTVKIAGKRIGSHVHFWVSDDGIGIQPDDLARLGEPFVQIRNDYTRDFDGAGLGLSLVKGLVELQHGTMSIESEPGRGTTVTISLPVAQPATGATDLAKSRATTLNAYDEDYNGKLRKTA